MEIDGYQWLIILHLKYGLSIRSSLNNWYQSDVPEPFTDNLQTNNLLTSVEGQVLLFYLLNAWGKVVNFCFKMNCFCKLLNVTICACGIPGKQWKGEEFCSCWAGPRIVFILDKMWQCRIALPMNKVYLFIVMFLVHTHASKWFILA